MYYEINVSHNGKHLFATAGRSITSEMALKTVYPILHSKFLESDGYKITVTYFSETGKHINITGSYLESLIW